MFISIDAGDDEGVLETTAEAVSGRQLVVNAVTRGNGEIRIEVLDREGSVLPGFATESCAPFQGDSVSHTVRWKENALAGLEGDDYSFRFRMRQASLYAYTLNLSP